MVYMYVTILCPTTVDRCIMAATPFDETPSVTAVSSPSARRLYYELENHGTATVEELSETLEYDPERVDALLTTLASHDLVVEDDGVVQA